MLFIELFIDYWRWHYGRAIKNIFSIWRDFIWFTWNFFSIGQLTRTLFIPWRRFVESSPAGISDPFNYFSAIAMTLLMRILGAIIRTLVILAGIISLIFMIISGVIFMLVWILLPVLLAVTFSIGLNLLVQSK